MRRRLAHGLVVVLLVSIGTGVGRNPIRSGSNRTQSTQWPRNNELTQTSQRVARKSFQVGAASWYGEQYDGKTTASGEPFDMYDLTAAHATLPLGTIVQVTNLSNGKTVIVRVNDRGPSVKGRIIDVSYHAASVLDFLKKGVQRVRLDFEECPPEQTARIASALGPNCPSYRALAVNRISSVCIIRRRGQRFSSTQSSIVGTSRLAKPSLGTKASTTFKACPATSTLPESMMIGASGLSRLIAIANSCPFISGML
jgi:peptidoglycan lytic transglycosylase